MAMSSMLHMSASGFGQSLFEEYAMCLQVQQQVRHGQNACQVLGREAEIDTLEYALLSHRK
jgi:hypothetical protein